MVSEPRNGYSTKVDNIKIEMNKFLFFSYESPRNVLVISILSFPGWVSQTSFTDFHLLVQTEPQYFSFFCFSFLPFSLPSFQKPLRDIVDHFPLPLLCSSPHPICFLPEFPPSSTQSYKKKQRVQCKCPKLLDTRNIFFKSLEK